MTCVPLVLTRPRAEALWGQLEAAPLEAMALGIDSPDTFWTVMSARDNVFFDLPDGAGIIAFLHVVPRVEATVRFAIFLRGPGTLVPMQETFRAALRFMFLTFGLNRVTAWVAGRDFRGAYLVQRLGFVWEGTKREGWVANGVTSDLHLNGLLRSEFEATDPRRVAA